MKTTKTLLLTLAALSTMVAHSAVKGVEDVDQPIAASEPSSVVDTAASPDGAKDAKIAALESRVAELEARTEAYQAKIAAIEKRIYPTTRISSSRGRGHNARR